MLDATSLRVARPAWGAAGPGRRRESGLRPSGERRFEGESPARRECSAGGDNRGVRITGIDHIVLTVASVEASVDFYSRVLGMDVVTFGRGRTALRLGDQKINLLYVLSKPLS